MIKKADKNADGKISYSEFRVMLGATPLLLGQPANSLIFIAEQNYGNNF